MGEDSKYMMMCIDIHMWYANYAYIYLNKLLLGGLKVGQGHPRRST